MKGIFENKELKIIGVETMDMRAYEPMFHSHGEIFYVSEGRISVNIDGNKRELTSGDMCVVFPYAIHSYEPIGKVKALYVLFSTESAGEFAETLLSWRAENPFLEKGDEYLPLIKKAILYSKGNTPSEQKAAGAYLRAILGEFTVNTELKDMRSANPDTIRAILSYCSEHFCENISLKNIADSVFVSERYITGIFAQRIGCSFRKYINNLRIQKAVELMENTSMRITDVMYECGFKNQSTFNKVFLEEKGMTPREYRKGC